MRLTGSKSALNDASRRLLADWLRTKEAWRDRKADEFERAYLSDLSDRVNAALQAIEDLDKLLVEIHNDCE
jgi:hypothetical protein